MLLLGVTTFAAAQRNAASPDKIHLPEGFKIELLYTVPRDKQGSWVAMCLDDKNRLIVSDIAINLKRAQWYGIAFKAAQWHCSHQIQC